MECNNRHCMWSFNGACCHEDYEKAYQIAKPNELDCPASLRKDFQMQLYTLRDECASLLDRRNMKELIAIKKFIMSQREGK
ncbi:hypothetical protein [Phage f2b1]|nr:hypothetical protein [Phage f2b1]